LLAPVHEHLIRVLEPAPGLRWLDLGTGTGAVALLAARAGAEVVGLDLAPALIETARRRASAATVSVSFEVGDAEALPYSDRSFDAISSAMGIIFASDHRAVVRELARVCRPGGRIAYSAWRPGGAWSPVWSRYIPPPLPTSDDLRNEESAERLLGDAFEVRFEEGEAPQTGESGEHMWQLLMTSSGLFRSDVESLPPDQRESLHRDCVEFADAHRRDGRVHMRSQYLVVVGHRRA
jgi:SAM-dependent methyltransferase